MISRTPHLKIQPDPSQPPLDGQNSMPTLNGPVRVLSGAKLLEFSEEVRGQSLNSELSSRSLNFSINLANVCLISHPG